MKETNKICMVPFRELHINYNGHFRSCCIQKGNLYKEKIKLTVDDPNRWFDEESFLTKVRIDLKNDVEHPACQKCWDLEKKGMSSYRKNWNQQYVSANNIDLNSRIEVIDLRLGNRCNLKCRMCNSTWSNQISNDLEELKKLGISNSYTQMPILGTVKQDDNFLDNLLYFVKNTPTVKEIKLAGGEPFVMDEVEEFLIKLVENNITDLKVSFTTNVTVVKDRIVEILEKFSSTHIQCSIDGVGKLLEYQRYPGKWEVIDRNFKKLYNANLTVNLTPCWSNLNILSVSDFLKWTQQFPKSHVAYNEVNHPSYLDWRHVPLDARTEEIKKLKSLTLHSKVHRDYKKFIEKFETEYLEFSQDSLAQFTDAITAWNLTSKIKYQDLYSWNSLILK